MNASDNLESIWASPLGDALDALDALMAQHGSILDRCGLQQIRGPAVNGRAYC